MKKNFKILITLAVALLLVCATVGFTVMADDEAAATPTVEIYKKNISYDDVIQLTYAIKVDGMSEGQKVQLLFGETTLDIGSATNVADVTGTCYAKEQKEGNEITIDDVTYPVIFSTGISAAKMTTPVYALPVITDAEGNIIASGECVEYSLYDYCMARFYEGTPTEDQQALYKALLDFGAAVQDLFLADGATAPADGWADAYCRLVFCDTMLADDGSYVRGNDSNYNAQFVRPDEAVTFTASETDKNGHSFQGIYLDGKEVSETATYTCSTSTIGSTYVMAAYIHEYTEEIVNLKTLVSTATLTSPAVYLGTCTCGAVGTDTFEYGTALPAYEKGNGQYYNDHGNYIGTSKDWSAALTSSEYIARDDGTLIPAINSDGEAVITTKTYSHLLIKNTNTIEGTKHFVETDIKFSDVAYYNGERLGALSLTASTANGAFGNAFLNLYMYAQPGDDGAYDILLSSDASSSTGTVSNGTKVQLATLDTDTWYNIRIVAVEVTGTSVVFNLYINGQLVIQESVNGTRSANTAGKLTGLGIEVGGSEETAIDDLTITLDNTFIATLCENHTYTEEVASSDTLASDATASSPALYYKSCACGAVSDTETFGVGYPLFVSGTGKYYNDNENYVGNTISAFSPTIGAWYSPAVQGAISPSYYGTNHVFETDVMFDVDELKYSATTSTCLGWFGVTCCSTNSNQHIILGFEIYPVLDENNMVTAVKLQGYGCSASAVELASGTWYNIRVEAVANTDDLNSVVNFYVNGMLVAENVTFKAQQSVEQNTAIYGFKYTARTPSTMETGYTSGTVSFANMFYGTKEIELGTGVYYNNSGEYEGTKLDFSTTSGLFSKQGTYTSVSDGKLVSAFSGWAHSTLTGLSVKGTSHVFEFDVMFDGTTFTPNGGAASANSPLTFGWFGLSTATASSNGLQFAGLYLNAIVDDSSSYTAQTLKGVGLGNTATNNHVVLELGRWYNISMLITNDGTNSIADIYVNGVCVATGVTLYTGTATFDQIVGVNITNRNDWGDVVMTLDNMFFGTIPAEE